MIYDVNHTEELKHDALTKFLHFNLIERRRKICDNDVKKRGGFDINIKSL